MTENFLTALFDIAKAPWQTWSPGQNLVQTALLVCVVLGIVCFIKKICWGVCK